MRRHAMQDEGGRRNQAIAPFLLNTGQARQKLVGHILAQTGFSEMIARNFKNFFALFAVKRVFSVQSSV
jgi:hypothetical protein